MVSDRGGHREIYVTNPDGSGVIKLLDSPTGDLNPVPSPDGTRVGFLRHVDTVILLQIMNTDGSNLISTYFRTDDATWSPDGSRLAMMVTDTRGIWFTPKVVDRTGSVVSAFDLSFCAGDSPSWSPDGSQLAYILCPSGAVYVREVAAGTTTTPVPDSDLDDDAYLPAWSPDGAAIAFAIRVDDPDQTGIFVVGPDGSGLTRLAPDSAVRTLQWSPDGSRLAFVSGVGGDNEVYVMNPDGAGRLNLTQDPADDSHVTWAPSGTRLAFQSDRTGNHEIFAVDVDGTHVANLTNSPADDEEPAWSSAKAAP